MMLPATFSSAVESNNNNAIRTPNGTILAKDSDEKSMKVGQPTTPSIAEFFADLAVEAHEQISTKTYRIGIDPFVPPASFDNEMEEAIETAPEPFAFTNITTKAIDSEHPQGITLTNKNLHVDYPPVHVKTLRQLELERAPRMPDDTFSYSNINNDVKQDSYSDTKILRI
jgi:hypothetical protein